MYYIGFDHNYNAYCVQQGKANNEVGDNESMKGKSYKYALLYVPDTVEVVWLLD